MLTLLVAASLAAQPQGDNPALSRAAVEAAQEAARAQHAAEKECAPLEAQPVPLERELALGQKHLQALRKAHGPTATGKLADDVRKVGEALARGASRKELTWTFEVLENPAPRSGFAPGGTVLVTTGLLAALKNEAQLASVLAHELAHLDLHVPAALSKANADACRSRHTAAALPPLGPAMPGLGGMEKALAGALADTPFLMRLQLGPSRDEVLAADAAAVATLAKAGYAAAEYRKVLEGVPWQALAGGAQPKAADRVRALGKALDAKGGRAGR